MSAANHLSEVQFRPLREVANMMSGDFGGRAGDITSKWLDDLPHRSEDEHEEMSKQQALTDDIRKNGMRSPLTIRHWPASSFGPGGHELHNGHHRLMAAMEIGLSHVPTRRWNHDGE